MERPLGLNERQILAAQSLAAGMTWRDTARRAKCSVEAVREWKKHDEFLDAIWGYQQEMFQQSFGATTAALPTAIQKLQRIVEDPDPDLKTSDQIAACKILIDCAQKQYETRTIERRIEQLEKYARANVTVEAEPIREISAGETLS